MANDFFAFKEFTIHQNRPTFKVGTDGVLLGAVAEYWRLLDTYFDIGTGTGLIAIMCAQRSKARITAIEPDKESFLQAVNNARACRCLTGLLFCIQIFRVLFLFQIINLIWLSQTRLFHKLPFEPDMIKSATRQFILTFSQ